MALSGTLTNTKWCTTDGSVISCTADTPTGAGTITQVGDITTGAAFTSGVAGKYLYFTNDVSGSMLLEPTQGSGIGTKTVFLPIPAAANGTLALTASPTFTALVTVPAYAAATAGLVINATQVQTSAA
jgi:hypothetical protein